MALWYLVLPHWTGGTVFRDLTKRYHGTLTSFTPSTAWIKDYPPGGWGSIQFNGTSNYINTGYGPNLTTSQSLWIRCRVYAPSGTQNYVFGSISNNNNPDDCFIRFSLDDDFKYDVRDDDGGTATVVEEVNANLPDEWRTWDLVLDKVNNQLVLYMNGHIRGSTALGAQSGSYSFNDYPFFIGAINTRGTPGTYNEMRLSDFQVFERLPTAVDVAYLYHQSLLGYPDLLRRIPMHVRSPVAGGGVSSSLLQMMLAQNQFTGGLSV